MIGFAPISEEHVEILADAMAAAYRQPPWNEVWTQEQASESIRYTMSGVGARGYVLLEDGKPVGSLFGRIQLYRDYEFYVNQLFIAPDAQKKGYGRRLLAYAQEQLQGQGITSISLSTVCAVQPFYEKCGYQAADWLEMQRKL